MSNEPVVTVSKRGAGRIQSGHPWVYRDDVAADGIEAGSVVGVLGPRGRFLGRAFYSDRSTIALRLLTRQDIPVDRAFFQQRLERAMARRRRFYPDAEAFRLVNSEADELPSLIVDRYGDYVVVQSLSQAMDRWQETVVELLEQLVKPRAIVERNDAGVRQLEGLELRSGVLRGDCPDEVWFREGDVQQPAGLLHGQKTGAYLDQRENRLATRRYARGRALDCFTHTGGFALHLARCCDSVQAVDSSAAALTTARRAAERNLISNVEWVEDSVFDLLKAHDQRGESFDTIVLDPPSFTRNRASVPGALRGYKEINLRAMKLLREDGILVTCSCSHHIAEDLFLQTLAEAALDAGRTTTILERRTQSRDHPILLTVPETLYLKCIVLLISRSG
ncbi:MAG: class I SAM-dependent rRNA methyltransferase [Acidobacteriota bacterium]